MNSQGGVGSLTAGDLTKALHEIDPRRGSVEGFVVVTDGLPDADIT